MRICYVNGEFVPEDKAQVSIFDRGYLFSDGAYEVSLVVNRNLISNIPHLIRLEGSLAKLGIMMPMSINEFVEIQKELIAKNDMRVGSIYIQVTRGVDKDRDFLYSKDIKPSVIMIPKMDDLLESAVTVSGFSVMTMPEIRWAKRDIKTIGLLGSVLAKKIAKEKGFHDAWFVEDGFVTEGSSNNVFIVKGMNIITKKANSQILNGITRQSVINITEEKGMTICERDFTVEEAVAADEVFVTSATMLIVPIVKIDDKFVANGRPGTITLAIREEYIRNATMQTTDS